MAREKSESEIPIMESPKVLKKVDNFKETKDSLFVIEMGNYVLLFDKDRKYLDKLQNHKIQTIKDCCFVNIVSMVTRELGVFNEPAPDEI